MAVNAKRYTFWPTRGMRDENDMPPLWSVQKEMVLASDYQDMWDTALKRWQTIQRLEGALEAAEELAYRPFPKPFNVETYTPFYVEWCADRERIFGSPADGEVIK